MKGLVITETVYESILDFTHDMRQTAKRILVPDANNLVITPYGEQVYAWEGFERDKDCKVVKEIEVPDELVEKATAFARAKAEFNQLKDKFEALL